MAAFSFNLGFYAFSEWNAAATTNETVYYTDPLPTITLGAAATITNIIVNDDDGPDANTFDDGFVDTPGDGSPPSTANNDQVLDQAVTVNGTNYPAGSQVELEFAFVTTTGETFWIIRIAGDNVGISGPTLPTPGSSYTVDTDDGTNDGQMIPVDQVPCFTAQSQILTMNGWTQVSDLSLGDRIVTADNGAQEIRWIGSKRLAGMNLPSHLRPIVIPKDAFGEGRPFRDTVVSPQHRFLIREWECQMLFGESEAFVAAKLFRSGHCLSPFAVEYWHLMLDQHEVIFVNGLETESFFPGLGGLNSLGSRSQKEVLELFPRLKSDASSYGTTSRFCLNAREYEILADRCA
ncbi:MAG: Hint domain-containing protein [Boseongicola sp.]